MANQRDIKRRISSVINTQKITKAMKLVAAAKFARASHAVNSARPYSQAFDAMVGKLVAAHGGANLKSPLLRNLEEKRILVVVLGTDRGLCGGLNTNLFRNVRTWLNEKNRDGKTKFSLYAWGRKAASWAKKQDEEFYGQVEKVLDRPTYNYAKELTDSLVQLFLQEKFDAIYLANNCFINALTQKPQVTKLLPVVAEVTEQVSVSDDIIVEPSLDDMLEKLLQRKLTALVFQAMLDGAASEQGSRMTAMDNATTNAGEVRKKLVLKYNRARQAAITKELIEIISGAEAL